LFAAWTFRRERSRSRISADRTGADTPLPRFESAGFAFSVEIER
jgi:hypothetical protein